MNTAACTSCALADPAYGDVNSAAEGGAPTGSTQLHWIDREIGWLLLAAIAVGVTAAVLLKSK